MTITMAIPQKDNQPPPPNPLNVLNLLLSKLKAMETTDSTGEITEVDVDLCNKIYYILNPAAAPPADEVLPVGDVSAEGEVPPSAEEESVAVVEGEEVIPADGVQLIDITDTTPLVDDSPALQVELPITDISPTEPVSADPVPSIEAPA